MMIDREEDSKPPAEALVYTFGAHQDTNKVT